MHHEQGLKHKQAVATHIANTKKKAMQEKKEHDMALKSMAKLERMAKQQYEASPLLQDPCCRDAAAALPARSQWSRDPRTTR